eukprot:scaffold1321_cov402-Prasinococcus_capsulatus_cf.AAC.8
MREQWAAQAPNPLEGWGLERAERGSREACAPRRTAASAAVGRAATPSPRGEAARGIGPLRLPPGGRAIVQGVSRARAYGTGDRRPCSLGRTAAARTQDTRDWTGLDSARLDSDHHETRRDETRRAQQRLLRPPRPTYCKWRCGPRRGRAPAAPAVARREVGRKPTPTYSTSSLAARVFRSRARACPRHPTRRRRRRRPALSTSYMYMYGVQFTCPGWRPVLLLNVGCCA